MAKALYNIAILNALGQFKLIAFTFTFTCDYLNQTSLPYLSFRLVSSAVVIRFGQTVLTSAIEKLLTSMAVRKPKLVAADTKSPVHSAKIMKSKPEVTKGPLSARSPAVSSVNSHRAKRYKNGVLNLEKTPTHLLDMYVILLTL